MKNSCHVGVEVDMFYKLAFFFLLEKHLFLAHKLLQPEATESLHCLTVLKASREIKRKLIFPSVFFMTKQTKEFRLLHKK